MSEIPFEATSYAERTLSAFPPPLPSFLASPFPFEDDPLRSERDMDVGLEVSAGLKVEEGEVELEASPPAEVRSRSATRASRSCSISCRVVMTGEGDEREGGKEEAGEEEWR